MEPCEQHKSQRSRETRRQGLAKAPYRAWYSSRAWQRASKAQLTREPNCRRCGKPATQADHITPISEGGDPLGPLQSLCGRCHAIKGREDAHRRRGA